MKPSQLPRLAAFVCAGLLFVVNALGDTSSHGSAKTISADEALAKLLEGNKRFVNGKENHPDQDAARRLEQSKGQTPTAIVLACSDSRVPPEILFDQGLGSIFVIRNAGNVLDAHVIGSIEYAVAHL
ncbi:MAG: hypothetical protein MUE42_07040, partial [Opitutaceae bacterium]|nr:hypothetical protein [Opitutaceae bacterium]